MEVVIKYNDHAHVQNTLKDMVRMSQRTDLKRPRQLYTDNKRMKFNSLDYIFAYELKWQDNIVYITICGKLLTPFQTTKC